MTDEQINVAIAEECGITQPDQYGTLYPTKNGWEYNCPDYCNDLNAMHEAEAKLSFEKLYRMEAHLKQIVGAVCFRATARQRAEAFLRTLGKWEEVQG